MNIKEQLLVEHSKKNARLIADYIKSDYNRFSEFIDCFLSDEYRVSQRSAMVLTILTDEVPQYLDKYIRSFVNVLLNKETKVASKRVIIRFFQDYDLPEEFQGLVLDRCYQLIKDPKETVAVKAFSIGALYRISKHYKELKDELKLVLQDLNTEESAGLRSRKNNVLKLL